MRYKECQFCVNRGKEEICTDCMPSNFLTGKKFGPDHRKEKEDPLPFKIPDDFKDNIGDRPADVISQRKEKMKERKCVMCDKDIKGFRDQQSLREWEISGICQDCQDGVFGEY